MRSTWHLRSRDQTTASGRYVRFWSDADEVAASTAGPVAVAVTHENYRYETPLTEISSQRRPPTFANEKVLGRSAFLWFARPYGWGTMPRCGQQPGDGTA